MYPVLVLFLSFLVLVLLATQASALGYKDFEFLYEVTAGAYRIFQAYSNWSKS